MPKRRNLAATAPTSGTHRPGRRKGTGLRLLLAETAEQVKQQPPPITVHLHLDPGQRQRLAELRWFRQETTAQIVARLLLAELADPPPGGPR